MKHFETLEIADVCIGVDGQLVPLTADAVAVINHLSDRLKIAEKKLQECEQSAAETQSWEDHINILTALGLIEIDRS